MLVKLLSILLLVSSFTSVKSSDVMDVISDDNNKTLACTSDFDCEKGQNWMFWLLIARCRKPVQNINGYVHISSAVCVEELDKEKLNITLIASAIFVLIFVLSVCGYVQLENRRYATSYTERTLPADASSSDKKHKKKEKVDKPALPSKEFAVSSTKKRMRKKTQRKKNVSEAPAAPPTIMGNVGPQPALPPPGYTPSY